MVEPSRYDLDTKKLIEGSLAENLVSDREASEITALLEEERYIDLLEIAALNRQMASG